MILVRRLALFNFPSSLYSLTEMRQTPTDLRILTPPYSTSPTAPDLSPYDPPADMCPVLPLELCASCPQVTDLAGDVSTLTASMVTSSLLGRPLTAETFELHGPIEAETAL